MHLSTQSTQDRKVPSFVFPCTVTAVDVPILFLALKRKVNTVLLASPVISNIVLVVVSTVPGSP